MAPKDDPETAALKEEITKMVEQMKVEQDKMNDCKLVEKCADLGDIPKVKLTTKKSLKVILY